MGYQRGAFLAGWGGDGEMDGAAFDCRNADACIVFLGLSALGVSDYHPPLYEEHVRPYTLHFPKPLFTGSCGTGNRVRH